MQTVRRDKEERWKGKAIIRPSFFWHLRNDRVDGPGYLRNLSEEARRVRVILAEAERAGLCQVILRQNVTLNELLDVFQAAENRNRITIFHFGGHANGYQLLLQDAEGNGAFADAGGLASFLAQQNGLELLFLNGCSTAAQTKGLLDAGVAAVISTSQAIDDGVATDFAARVYQGLATGVDIGRSFREAEAAVRMASGDAVRDLYCVQDSGPVTIADQLPWMLHVGDGAEIITKWNLYEATNNPLLGLPPLPDRDLPARPFRHLHWFRREDASIFFGRGRQIRDLYQRVTDSQGAPILLFYGQSGVGKSSLLEAGLLPRLEASHDVCYLWRDRALGLAGTLEIALRPTSQRSSRSEEDPDLGRRWRQREDESDKPLLIILDQVEELFTRQNSESQQEFGLFLAELQNIFVARERRPHGKLILAFRKEWLAEIERRVAEARLPTAKVFLQRLDRDGVMEAIDGVARTPRLRQHYRLHVASEVPALIADDLLADQSSAVAPTLQVLLSKLWERASERDNEQPVIDQALYQALKRDGILLNDFLDQQMASLSRWNEEVVSSGLALDLLAFHTTSLGTAAARSRAELEEHYSHRREILTDVIQQCKDLFLLVDPDQRQKKRAHDSRLAHDALAPLVRRRFDDSDCPGQRARRVLESRAVDWQEGQTGSPLDERDLGLVESGAPGMRSRSKSEQRLVDASIAERTARLEQAIRAAEEKEASRERDSRLSEMRVGAYR